jgi:Tfp pilus assembly protein PilP
MRALVFTFILVGATPHASVAQGDAAMAAARAAGKPAAKPAGSAARAESRPAARAEGNATKPAADSPAPVVATPADAAASPALQNRGFTYTPEGRRDPFVDLLRRGTGVDLAAISGPRPTGLKGLGTGEVTLKGTMASKGAYVGILQGSDSRTYVVHPGEKLFDGTVRTITADSMVILQQVNDPLSKETQREVRKVLRQTEEAK